MHGEVYLWGTVVEHRLGWRAQYAYPKSLFLPPDAIPFRMTEAESRLESLMAYGTDIFVATTTASTPSHIPLWSKQSGLDTAGFDWLMEKRKRWYSYREQGRTLKAGDRVAVLGRGIGVVATADINNAHVRMWNKTMLRIPRNQVTWNHRNWRWEAAASRTFAFDIQMRSQ